jgi:hypothetical protein
VGCIAMIILDTHIGLDWVIPLVPKLRLLVFREAGASKTWVSNLQAGNLRKALMGKALSVFLCLIRQRTWRIFRRLVVPPLGLAC